MALPPVYDTREAILARLEALLAGISGVAGVYRDRGDLGSMQLPAIILLDGTEDSTVSEEVRRMKSVRFPGSTTELRPYIVVIPQPRTDASNLYVELDPPKPGMPGPIVLAPIGPEISEWRMIVRNAIESDDQLLTILTPNGQVVYLGSDTDMVPESDTLLGRLLLRYAFLYWAEPA